MTDVGGDAAKRIDRYWLEIASVTVYEAAYWMVIGADPQVHEEKCDLVINPDATQKYRDYFDIHPGGSESVVQQCEIIDTAIRAGYIGLIPCSEISDESPKAAVRRIVKSDWLSWCRTIGHAGLADKFVIEVASDTASGGCVDASETVVEAVPNNRADASSTARSPLPRQRFQEQEILRVLEALGYEPQALPPRIPGRSGVKAAVRAELDFPSNVFDKAWDRLRSEGAIRELG
jgi:hypothetical protein